MILKRRASGSQPATPRRWLSRVLAGLGLTSAAVTLAAGCLDRPVEPQDPSTSNVYVAEIRQTAVDKIDLLFMIDNSISMADKQAILRQAVPVLLTRLVSPICVNADGSPAGGTSPNCPGDSEPEFSAIRDIHIGVVTSSLGAHGGQVCTMPTDDDKAHLIGTNRPAFMPPLTSWAGSGFLAWDPDDMRPRNNPQGMRTAEELIPAFQNHVAAAGENGCGYEASLEAWYRFLVDPNPPTAVQLALDANGAPAFTQVSFDPPDTTILAQRDAFLRPDSLVAIIMLTDENDCSIRDDGQGWLVGLQSFGNQPYYMPRATSTCNMNPNAPCCLSCDADENNVPPACSGFKQDIECQKGKYTSNEDNANLRCWDQKRRFGFDLLYGIQERYLPALTSPVIASRNADPVTGAPVMVPNPLFEGTPPRDPSLIFLAGIVGVPWQDIARENSLNDDARLEYMTYKELQDNGRWDMILGNPGDATTNPVLPTDGLMIETTLDRSTLGLAPHPITGQAIAPPTAPQTANRINGHESSIGDNSDLQFACTFQLPTARECADELGCDCKMGDAQFNRSLCQGTTQTHAKAYPGVRHLQLLKAVGERTGNSIVASICPKSTNMAQEQAYGYTPAVAAIIDRLKEALRGKCLPRRLDVDETTGAVPCVVVEAAAPAAGQGCQPCSALPGRADAAAELTPAVHRQLESSDYCTTRGEAGFAPCESFCLCEIQQFQGGDLDRCQTSGTAPADIFGYCYVDPAAIDPTGPNAGDIPAQEAIVANCPSTQKRLLRFTGDNVPARGAIALIACIGASISDAADLPMAP